MAISQDGAATSAGARLSRIRLWAEFLSLYLATPLAVAFVFPPDAAFAVLFVMTAVGTLLLSLTPGFHWRALLGGGLARWWRETLAFVALTAIGVATVTLWIAPERWLWLPTHVPWLWAAIMALYPLLSVLPQELLYRPLFFDRYGSLFPTQGVAIAVNAVAFGLMHLFFFNWPAVLMTTFGGAAFAYAYAVRGSFGLACLWHALAGQLVFTLGLGVFFYHGAIPS